MDEDPPSDGHPPDTPPAPDLLEVEDVVGTLLGLDQGGHPITSWSDRLPGLPPCISRTIGWVFLAIDSDPRPRGLAQVVVIPVTKELKPMGRSSSQLLGKPTGAGPGGRIIPIWALC